MRLRRAYNNLISLGQLHQIIEMKLSSQDLWSRGEEAVSTGHFGTVKAYIRSIRTDRHNRT